MEHTSNTTIDRIRCMVTSTNAGHNQRPPYGFKSTLLQEIYWAEIVEQTRQTRQTTQVISEKAHHPIHYGFFIL